MFSYYNYYKFIGLYLTSLTLQAQENCALDINQNLFYNSEVFISVTYDHTMSIQNQNQELFFNLDFKGDFLFYGDIVDENNKLKKEYKKRFMGLYNDYKDCGKNCFNNLIDYKEKYKVITASKDTIFSIEKTKDNQKMDIIIPRHLVIKDSMSNIYSFNYCSKFGNEYSIEIQHPKLRIYDEFVNAEGLFTIYKFSNKHKYILFSRTISLGATIKELKLFEVAAYDVPVIIIEQENSIPYATTKYYTILLQSDWSYNYSCSIN